MTVHIYRLTDDRDGWNHVATVNEQGDFIAHTEFAEEELAEMVTQYKLPEETDALLKHFSGPYIHAKEVE